VVEDERKEIGDVRGADRWELRQGTDKVCTKLFASAKFLSLGTMMIARVFFSCPLFYRHIRDYGTPLERDQNCFGTL
jgi:hypothetical protein